MTSIGRHPQPVCFFAGYGVVGKRSEAWAKA